MKLDIQPLDIQPIEEAPAKGSSSLDLQPLDLQPLKPAERTSFKEDVKTGFANVGNTVDTAWSMLAGSLASVFKQDDDAKAIYEGLERRRKQRSEWANPEGKEQGFGGKVTSVVSTLPAQVLTFPLSPFETGKTAIDQGESTGRAAAMTGIDTVGNIVGVALPAALGTSRVGRAASGAAINAAQDTATRAGIVSIAEQEGTKEALGPSMENAALAGVVGGAVGASLPRTTPNPRTPKDRLGNLDKYKKPEVETKPAATKLDIQPVQPELDLFGRDQTRVGLSPFETSQGQMRVDENGIPYRDDLSQELGRTERVGGDTGDLFETPPSMATIDLEQGARKRAEMEQMWQERQPDAMVRDFEAEQQRRKEARDEAYSQLEQQLREQAYKPTRQGQGPKTRAARTDMSRGLGRSQRGGIDLDAILEALPFRFRSLEAVQTRNRKNVPAEQIKQSINRSDVPEAERVAINKALELSNNGENSLMFSKVMGDEFNKFTLLRDDGKAFYVSKEAGRWPHIGRVPRDFEDFGLDRLGYENFPGRVNFYKLPDSIIPGINHWNTPQLFGHTRSFYDKQGGTKHVIEIQSDGIQKMNAKWTPEDDVKLKAAQQELNQAQKEVADFRNAHATGVGLAKTSVKFRRLKKQEERIALKVQELLTKQNAAKYAPQLKTAFNFYKPTLSTYFYRLIREELADSARAGETSVRFMDAETMVKVEGWEEFSLGKLEEDLKWAKINLEFDKAKHASLEEIQEREAMIAEIQSEIDSWTLPKDVQSIKDRYKNEMEPFLESLGGQRVTDENGNTWIEVPVDPKFAKPVPFGKTGTLRGQRGAIDLEAFDFLKKLKVQRKLLGQADTGIPKDPLAQSVVEAARGEPDGKPNRLFAAGATLEGRKQNSAVLDAAGDIVQNWGKRSELWVRDNVFPMEKELRGLSAQDKVDLSQIMRKGWEDGATYNADILMREGYNERVATAYTKFQKLFQDTLDIQNQARAIRGESMIKPEEAYFSSVWQGDFGARILDAEGNTVWVVRADTRYGVNAQVKKILELFPELKRGDEFDKLNTRGADRNAIQSAYSTMVDLLGRNNPTVQAVKEAVEGLYKQEMESALGQPQHFKEKAGIQGYQGSRPWINPKTEAVNFFEAQLQYAKNASKWGEIQKASDNLNALLSDPELNERQPNNVKWAKEYVQRELGFGEVKEIREFENMLGRVTGVSPDAVARAVGQVKFLWITQKLALSPGYIASNAFQLTNTLPWHTDLSVKGFSGNPVATAGAGFVHGLNLGLNHYLKYSAESQKFSKLMRDNFMVPDHILGAMEYAETNSVTNRSVFDEAGIQPNRAALAVQKTVAVPETFARSMAYMSFVQHLYDSGQFPPERWQEMYQLAEKYTNMSMGDARPSERAPIFAKAGITGNLFNTLQTYTVNWFNQYAYFARELAKGNPLPMFVGLATTATIAGMMGIPLANDIHNIWEWIKKQLPNNLWNKVRDWDIKMAMMEYFGNSGTYGVLSAATGVNWSTRLASPQLLEAPTMPGGMITDIGEQAWNWLSAGAKIDDPVAWHQAVISSMPPGMKELYAQEIAGKYTQSPARPDGSVNIFARKDIGNREATVNRTPEQQAIAKWGVRSQKEVVEGDLNAWRRNQELQMRERRTKQIDKIYRSIRTKTDADIADDVELYINLGGDADGLIQGLERKVQNEFLTRQERGDLSAADNIEQAKLLIRIKKLKEQFGYAN